eukprot:767833-Hanusia_phi.AAC.4
MRDHPSHSLYPISAGLWGGTRDAVPEMELLLRQRRTLMSNDFIIDTEFINDALWPRMRGRVLQHDSFSCMKYDALPFPSRMDSERFVGEVFIDGAPRQSDLVVLRSAHRPVECMDRS